MTSTAEATPLLDEARQLIDAATERGIVLRLLGGLAIAFLSPELPPRTRMGQDLDFASRSATRRDLADMLGEHGYLPDKTFNALYGNKQLYFANPATGLAVDVLIDKLHMCHTLEFADRLERLPYTLDPMDLLLTKMQIVELNEKDLEDCLRLLVTFPLGESSDPNVMDIRIFQALVGNDWGWWKTITLNLERMRSVLANGRPAAISGGGLDPVAQLAALAQAADDVPKSRGWKLRSRIGERKRWYEQPEETPHH